MGYVVLFFFKQKTAYEMRISDWSSDVCSSDLPPPSGNHAPCDRCQCDQLQRRPELRVEGRSQVVVPAAEERVAHLEQVRPAFPRLDRAEEQVGDLQMERNRAQGLEGDRGAGEQEGAVGDEPGGESP